MKTLVLLRMFLLFPFIGIAMPDAAFYFQDHHYKIPAVHFIIIGILVLVFFGTFIIKPKEAREI